MSALSTSAVAAAAVDDDNCLNANLGARTFVYTTMAAAATCIAASSCSSDGSGGKHSPEKFCFKGHKIP